MNTSDQSELEKKCAYFEKCTDDLAGKLTAADARGSIQRHELEQRRRGFGLLAELHAEFYDVDNVEELYRQVLVRTNATMNIDRSVLLERNGDVFRAVAWQGYLDDAAARFAGVALAICSDLDLAKTPLLVTQDQVPDETRAALEIPFYVAVPVILGGQVAAILVGGRMKESMPFFPRLDQGDVETFQATANVVAGSIERQRLAMALRETIDVQAKLLDNQRLALEEVNRINLAYGRFVPVEFWSVSTGGRSSTYNSAIKCKPK